MKAVVAAFNQERALVGAFSVLTNLRMELFQALLLAQQLGSTTNVTICNAGFSGGEWSQKATFLTDTESL